MPDYLGNMYEGLIAFSLHKLRKEFEVHKKDLPTRCREFCRYRKDCFGKYSPKIYVEPDFIIGSGDHLSIIYATHWRVAGSSQLKFYRTIEEFFEHKVHLGNSVFCMNVVFEVEKNVDGKLIGLGWKTALLESMDWIFDKSLYFNSPYLSERFEKIGRNLKSITVEAAQKEIEKIMIENIDGKLTSEIEGFVQLLGNKLKKCVKEEFFPLWELMRKTCSAGKYDLIEREEFSTRWRTGLLRLIVLLIIAEDALQSPKKALILAFSLNSPTIEKISEVTSIPTELVLETLTRLTRIVVRHHKDQVFYLIELHPTLFTTKVQLDNDLSITIENILSLSSIEEQQELVDIVHKMKGLYDQKKAIKYVLRDLRDTKRVEKKIQHVLTEISKTKPKNLAQRILAICTDVHFQDRIEDNWNWPLEVLCLSTQLVGSRYVRIIRPNFEKRFKVSIEKVAPFGNPAQILNCLVTRQYGRIGKKGIDRHLLIFYFHQKLAEIIAQRILENGVPESSRLFVTILEKKARRFFESPDINPLVDSTRFLVENQLKRKTDSFNCPSFFLDFLRRRKERGGVAKSRFQLALQTDKKAILVKVQAAQEGNQDHKRKELSGRIRSCLYELTMRDGKLNFAKRQILPFLILDGDWSKRDLENLLEAGFHQIAFVENLPKLISTIETSLEASRGIASKA